MAGKETRLLTNLGRNGGVGVQGGVIVEQVGYKGQIELVDAVDNVLGRQKTAAAQLVCLLEHQLGTAQQIVFLFRVTR